MARKNDFNVTVFVDSKGNADISGAELANWFDAQREMFIMDYADPQVHFTGQIAGQILDAAELKGALAAYSMYHQHLRYPHRYEQLLKKALADNLNPAEYSLEIQSENH